MKNRVKISKDLSKLSSNYTKKNSIRAVLEPYLDDIKAAKSRGVPAIRVFEVLIDNGLDIKIPTFYRFYKQLEVNKQSTAKTVTNTVNKSSKPNNKNKDSFRVANDDDLF